MAGSFAEAQQMILSVNPGAMTTMATAFRALAGAASQAGTTLHRSATEVGGQQGAPYAVYQKRLTPTATWVQRLEQPMTATASALDTAASVCQQAQWTLAQAQTMIQNAPPEQKAQAEAAALALLNPAIQNMTTAFNAIQAPDIGTAPGQRGGSTGAEGGSDASGAEQDPTAAEDPTATGEETGQGTGTGTDPTATGPQSGPYAGWVQDPTTGNLVDPATGREVDPSGRFVDPVTGQPFGDPSQYASRLEGLQGGVGANGGLLAGGSGLAPAPLSGPVATGATGATGGGGGMPFAPFYGGMVPPSLRGGNPAARQLRQKATDNLALRAETAQRYNQIATGATQPLGSAAVGQPAAAHPYLPPMAGAGMGAGLAGRGGAGRRRSKLMVSEPADIWAATGRGARGKQREQSTLGTEVEEDANVWTGGETAGSGVLGGR